jgi:SsrA-binding protein
MGKSVIINNKKSRFDYEFVRTLVAGFKLLGSEVKSIRDGRVSFVDSYCYFHEGEIFIKNLNITPISARYSHEPNRERKLLLKRKEIEKLKSEMDKGLSIVPVKIFTNERDLIKIEIALARGKKNYDKRNNIKERDLDREMKRSI